VKGFALVGALIGVVLIGALIVGAFAATMEETRISGNVRMGVRALSAAESAAEADLAGWAAGELDSLAVTQRAAHSTFVDGLPVTTTLIRLDSSIYWIVVEANDSALVPAATYGVRRRIGLLLRRVSDSTGKAALLRLEDRAWSELF
jgi:hypothetical protein